LGVNVRARNLSGSLE
jgi:hypothetical protein